MNQSQSKNNCGLLGFKPVGAFVLDQTVLSWQLLGFVFKRKKKVMTISTVYTKAKDGF